MEHTSWLTGSLVYLAAAVLAVPLAKFVGLGSIIGYLAAGILIGPWGLKFVTDPKDMGVDYPPANANAFAFALRCRAWAPAATGWTRCASSPTCATASIARNAPSGGRRPRRRHPAEVQLEHRAAPGKTKRFDLEHVGLPN